MKKGLVKPVWKKLYDAERELINIRGGSYAVTGIIPYD